MFGRCFSRLPSSVAADVGMVGKTLTATVSRISHLILVLILGLFCLVLLFQIVVSPAGAVDLVVLNTNDSGAGSLRQAIANAGNGDTVFFDSSLNGQTITLTSGQLLITKNLTISGPGANLLAISGNNASRVISITSNVTITGVTIKNGTLVRENIHEYGGGISNDGGIVNLINCIVVDNLSVGSLLMPGVGGGIYNDGIMNLTNTTVSSNTAGCGGGIASNGVMNLTNSIISNNTGTDSGGGIYLSDLGSVVNLTNTTVSRNSGGGIEIYFGMANLANSTISSNTGTHGGGIAMINGEANLTNSTVSGNIAAGSGGGIFSLSIVNLTNSTVSSNTAGNDGGGIYNGDGITTLTNTILAHNQVISTTNDCTNHFGTLASGGYNLVQAPNNCVFSATGDITNTDPLLAPLADNGGATLTHALLKGSLAINHIPQGTNGCDTTITTDQRGVLRPQGPGCDIGAYEAYEFGYLYLPLIFTNWGRDYGRIFYHPGPAQQIVGVS